MKQFIKTQYALYLSGAANIGIEKIKLLASKFMTVEEQNNLFGDK